MPSVSDDGSGIDDRAAAPEMGQGGLHEEKVRKNVCLKRMVQLLFGDVGDAELRVLNTVVVHQDIEPPEVAHRFMDHPLTVGFAAQIDFDELAAPPQRFNSPFVSSASEVSHK